MGRFLKNLLLGAGDVLELYPVQDYRRPCGNGFKRDSKKLRSDASRIARDMHSVVSKRGEQVNHS